MCENSIIKRLSFRQVESNGSKIHTHVVESNGSKIHTHVVESNGSKIHTHSNIDVNEIQANLIPNIHNKSFKSFKSS